MLCQTTNIGQELIVGLIVQRSRWKGAAGSLRDSEERMSLAAESANLGMWV